MDDQNLSSVIDAAGPITGFFVLLLGVALFFIWRSMNKQIDRAKENLPPGPEDERRAEEDSWVNEAVERGEDQADSQR